MALRVALRAGVAHGDIEEAVGPSRSRRRRARRWSRNSMIVRKACPESLVKSSAAISPTRATQSGRRIEARAGCSTCGSRGSRGGTRVRAGRSPGRGGSRGGSRPRAVLLPRRGRSVSRQMRPVSCSQIEEGRPARRGPGPTSRDDRSDSRRGGSASLDRRINAAMSRASAGRGAGMAGRRRLRR